MSGLDAVKAAALLLLAALVQVSIASSLEVAEGHPDLVLVLVVTIALLRGPAFGAAAGFGAGLFLDVASFQTLGLTSLLLTLAGYWAGRFGEVTRRDSAQPVIVAVAAATVAVAVGTLVLEFMLGSTIGAARLIVGVLLPTLALNLLVAYPVYRFSRRLFGPRKPPREVSLAV